MIKNGIITPNSIPLPKGKDYFAVGYRTNCYGKDEWLVKFTPSYNNALEYVENEKARHQFTYRHMTANLGSEYKIWKCCLDNAQVMPGERPPEPETLDY